MSEKNSILERLNYKMPSHRRKFAMLSAEFAGTAILLFFGCLGCTPKVGAGPLYPALAFGMTVMGIIVMFAPISGAHFNPAVTICGVLYGTLPVLMAPLYIIVQYLGGISGLALLKFLIPEEQMKKGEMGVCTTSLLEGLGVLEGFLLEFCSTGTLILLVCGVWDKRSANNQDSIPIKFGFAVTFLALTVGPFTGCGMNPARAFAPALLDSNWEHHWVYIVAPSLAGFCFTLWYIITFKTSEEEWDVTKKQMVSEDNTPLTLNGTLENSSSKNSKMSNPV